MATITVVHDCDIKRRGNPLAIEGDFMDCFLAENVPNNPHNNQRFISTAFILGDEKDEDFEDRGLFLYDLNFYLPAAAVITAAVWWPKVFNTSAVAGQTFYIKRCTRTNWVEASATWNKYDGTNTWTTAGGDTAAPEISLGDITTTGWKSFDVKTLVDDAWDNRAGILTFLMFRKHSGDGGADGFVDIEGKWFNDDRPHHLRITYTLDGKTFEALIQ